MDTLHLSVRNSVQIVPGREAVVKHEKSWRILRSNFPPFHGATDTILLFTRNDLGEAPVELQQKLAVKFLQLNVNTLPAKILLYTNGVKLASR